VPVALARGGQPGCRHPGPASRQRRWCWDHRSSISAALRSRLSLPALRWALLDSLRTSPLAEITCRLLSRSFRRRALLRRKGEASESWALGQGRRRPAPGVIDGQWLTRNRLRPRSSRRSSSRRPRTLETPRPTRCRPAAPSVPAGCAPFCLTAGTLCPAGTMQKPAGVNRRVMSIAVDCEPS
jgi:hypothetical protein